MTTGNSELRAYILFNLRVFFSISGQNYIDTRDRRVGLGFGLRLKLSEVVTVSAISRNRYSFQNIRIKWF